MRKLHHGLIATIFSLALAACSGGTNVGAATTSSGGTSTGGGTTVTCPAGQVLEPASGDCITSTGSTGSTATGVPQSLTLSPGQSSVIADGQSATLLTAMLLDTAGQPVAGKAISFAPNAGTVSAATATTDSSGRASVSLRSSTSAGRSTIVARESGSGLSSTATVNFVAGPATGVSVSAAPGTVAPAGQATISVVVVDANGNRVTGEPVALSFTTNASGGSLSSAALTTDSNGQATSDYTAGSNTGTDAIQGKLSSGVSSSSSVSVSAVVRPVNGLTLTLGNTTPPVNSSSSAIAKVVDSAGNPLSGITVNFQTTAGSIAGSGTTDSNGLASVTFTAPSSTGTVTIRASTSGIVSSATANVVAGAVNTVAISLAPNKVASGRATSVTAFVTDGNGNAVPNHGVQFSASPSASTTGSFSSATATTDAGGVATVSYTVASGTSGTINFTAVANPEGKTSNPVTLTIDPNAVSVSDITLSTVSGKVVADNGQSSAVLRATVNGSDGKPLSNVTVSLSTTLGTISTSSANTDANGIIQFQVASSAKAGSGTVTASSGGVSQQTTVTFVPGPLATLTLTLSNSSVAAGTSISAIASAVDAYGNPVPGESIVFSVPTNASAGSFTSGTTLSTGNDGTVAATYKTGTGTAGGVTDTLKIVSNFNTSKSDQQPLNINSNVGSLTLSAVAASIVANGSDATTLTAVLQDSNKNPLKNATVQFRTSKGTLNPSSGSAVTDNTGTASIRLISDKVSGNAVVTAVVSASGSSLLTASAPVQFAAGNPTAINIVAVSPSTVATGGSSSISLQVVDVNNNGVPSQNVKVSVSTNNSGGSPSLFALTTDATGHANVVYTAGSATGVTDTLSFATDNNVTQTQNIAVSATQATITGVVLSLGTTTFQAGGSGTVAVRATVSGSGGVVSGAGVTFSASSGTFSGGASSATATTDANGVATVQLTPPTKSSTVTLQVNASGFIDRGTLTVTPGAAASAQSTVNASPSVILADGSSTSTIMVTLNDQFSNPLPDGTAVSVTTTAGTFPNGSSSVLSNGQASFTLKSSSSTSPITATIAVSGVTGLSTTVQFTNATTGDPAALRLSAANSTIYVSGVGQNDATSITVTVLDSSGAAIKEAGYTTAGVNNLRVTFIARPSGGEVLSGRDANNAIVSSGTGNSVDVRTNNGLAVLNLQSGSISGIVELKFDVLKFASSGFNAASDVAVSATLPQVSIASGPAASIVFTQPTTNAVIVLKDSSGANSGNYRLVGSVNVRDRYDNNVPDGTVINLAALDTAILHDNTGATTAGGSTATRSGSSLITSRCNEPISGREVANSSCISSTSDFTTAVTRNNTSRVAQAGDLMLLRNAISQDKKRAIKSVDSATQVTVNAAYAATLTATTSTNSNNGEFWLGTQALGSNISGTDSTGNTYTTGSGVTKAGVVSIAVDYPANSGSILSGCYGYASPDGHYRDIDRRDSVPQSRQVVLAGTAGNGVTGINVGDFCFKAIAGATVTPGVSSLSLSAQSSSTTYQGAYANSASYAVNDIVVSNLNGRGYLNISAYTSPASGGDPGSAAGDTTHWQLLSGTSVPESVVDGGDKVPLSFLPIKCVVSYARGTIKGLAVAVSTNPNLYGLPSTGYDSSTGGPGFGSITVTRVDKVAGTDDVATVACNIADGVGSFTVKE